jgi:transposase
MARPISTDLRERLVLVLAREGISARSAAARFGVSVGSAIVWVRRYRETGSIAPSQIGGYKPNILGGSHGDRLIERTQTADFTLRGLVAELATRGVPVDCVQVWRFVHARGLSFKKSVLPAEQLRPRIARRRAQWQKYQGRLDPKRLVFIDETWAKTNMAPLRG